MAVLSPVGDYLVAMLLGWPGALLGLLLLADLVERAVDRRFVCSTRIKVVLAAIVAIVGVSTVHPDLSTPERSAIRRAEELRSRQSHDAAVQDPLERSQDPESDQRLKSEVDSLRKELTADHNRPR